MPAGTNRVHLFVDGQNLFRLARKWGEGYHWPKYDVRKLGDALTALEPGRVLCSIRFYTGVPTREQDERWHIFWTAKLRHMGEQGIRVYRGRIVDKQEKGVDVRIALDLVRSAREQSFDTAIVVSQDSDLNEALKEVRAIAHSQGREVRFESAFPYEKDFPYPPGEAVSHRGLTPATWRHISRAMYDACVDPTDYRPKLKPAPAPLGVQPATLADLMQKYNKPK